MNNQQQKRKQLPQKTHEASALQDIWKKLASGYLGCDGDVCILENSNLRILRSCNQSYTEPHYSYSNSNSKTLYDRSDDIDSHSFHTNIKYYPIDQDELCYASHRVFANGSMVPLRLLLTCSKHHRQRHFAKN